VRFSAVHLFGRYQGTLPNTASSKNPQNFDRTFSQQQTLVGGRTNPFEKDARQNRNLPQIGENQQK